MARIRTIKPEFPQSESMGRISRDARLLFILLWTYVDDSGRARASSRMLASLLFPYDDDAPTHIGRWLDELEAEGCIQRYIVDNTTYLEIAKWLNHQKIDRPSPSKLPDPSRALASPREPSMPDLGPRTKDLGDSSLRSEPSEADASAEANASAVVTPIDLKRELWRTGKTFLSKHGYSEKQAGSLIGRWRGEFGDVAVIEVLAATEVACPSGDVAGYVFGCLNKRKGFSNAGRSLSPASAIFAGAALVLADRERARAERSADYGEDIYPTKPLLDCK